MSQGLLGPRLKKAEEASSAIKKLLEALEPQIKAASMRAAAIRTPMKTLCLHGYGQNGPVGGELRVHSPAGSI